MSNEDREDTGEAVPRGRVARLSRMGRLGAGVVGGMVTEGVRRATKGEPIDARSLALTPSNASRVAKELSRMRGAAMKLGQILSMDTGDVIPPELRELLAPLRQAATPMPPRQLKSVLNNAWGPGWVQRFAHFDTTPLAAASIGQVHRAKTKDGRDLAIKVQYPGVKDAIDSDIDNVAQLIKLSNVLPKEIDIGPFLEDAKGQLHEEADYQIEASYLRSYTDKIAGDTRFAVPAVHDDLTTQTVLAMDFMPGDAIESLEDAPQDVRDLVIIRLFELVLRELFDFRCIQSDPNFANFMIDRQANTLILLDFGATQNIEQPLSEQYRALIRGCVRQDRDMAAAALREIGFTDERSNEDFNRRFLDILLLATAPLRYEGAFDFATQDVLSQVQEKGAEMRSYRGYQPVPPSKAFYIQRKIGGMFLLAARLKAKVDFGPLLSPYIDGDQAAA